MTSEDSNSEAATHEAVTRVRPVTRSTPDAPPPLPPHELEPEDGLCRRFEHEGEEWIARAAGKGAGGTGSYGLGMMEALHFARATDAMRPLFETLVAAGTLAGLYDDELVVLLGRARTIVTLEEVRAAAAARGGRGTGED